MVYSTFMFTLPACTIAALFEKLQAFECGQSGKNEKNGFLTKKA
jgi:hypothetical protein